MQAASSPFSSGNYGRNNLNHSGDFPKVVPHSLVPPTTSSFSMNLMALTDSFDQKNIRLASFSKWPSHARANPALLAEAGFYYTGEGAGDTVTCYSCKVKLNSWRDDMNPLEEHKKKSPGCAFIRNHHLRNAHSSDFPLFADIPEAHAPSFTPNHVNSFDDMTQEENRIRTFSSKPGWPENVPVKIEDLAKAGFFYTGDRDKVMCAFCRGRLLNWGLGDSAFGEHMRHFPRCSFLEKLAKEAEERDDLNRRAASLSITDSESGSSFQPQGNSGKFSTWLSYRLEISMRYSNFP